MNALATRHAHADPRMEVGRARRAGARDHRRGGGADGRGLSGRSHRHRGRQPGGRGARRGPAAGIGAARSTTSSLEEAAASRPAGCAQHGHVQRRLQRRRQPAHGAARGLAGISAARQGDAVERALRQRPSRRKAIRAAARCGRTRASRRRSARASARSSAIGASKFRVSRILISRPDQGATFLDLAPSLFMNEADIAGHAADPARQPAHARARCSRVRAPRSQSFKRLAQGEQEAKPKRSLDVDETAPQIKNAMDRIGRFLSIASLVAVLLCAIAVAMAARRYVHRHLDSVALMKTLGATRGFTLTVSLMQLIFVGIAGGDSRLTDRLRRAGLAGHRAQGSPARRAAAAGARAAGHRLPHVDRRARRFRAAAAAAALAHAGAARPAPRHRSAAAAGDARIRSRRARDRASSSSGCCATCRSSSASSSASRHSCWWSPPRAGCWSGSPTACAAASVFPGATGSRISAGAAPRASCSSPRSRTAS